MAGVEVDFEMIFTTELSDDEKETKKNNMKKELNDLRDSIMTRLGIEEIGMPKDANYHKPLLYNEMYHRPPHFTSPPPAGISLPKDGKVYVNEVMQEGHIIHWPVPNSNLNKVRVANSFFDGISISRKILLNSKMKEISILESISNNNKSLEFRI